MKVAVDVRSLMEGRLSGVEEYTMNVLEGMVRLGGGHEWHLFYNSLKPVRMPVGRLAGQGNVIWHGQRWPNKVLNIAQLAVTQPRWDRLLPGMDVFFVPNMRLMPLARRTPLVVTAHDLSFVRFPEFYSWRRRVWHKMVTPKILFRRANRVIAVSAATAWDLEDLYGIDPRKIRVVHSGVKISEAGVSAAEVKIKYRLPEKYWLFLGVQEPRKNIESLVRAYEAVAHRTGCDLVIAGSSGWLDSGLERLIRVSPVKERIHRVGFVEEKDKGGLYEGADLFVYPSFYEGFGFPPLEALMAGTPVVTARTGALPEVAGEWAVMVDPYNVNELAQVLDEFCGKKRPVSDEVKQEVRERFNWESAARKTLAILEEVCG